MSDDLPNPSKYHGNQKREQPADKPDEATEKETPEIIAQGIKRKKSVGKRFMEAFTGDDVQNVAQYVFWDVLIPAAKSAILDAITTGIERTLYGDSRPRSSVGGGYRTTGSYTSYNRASKPTSTRYDSGWKPRAERQMSRSARASHNFSEIILETRAQAEDVLEKLIDLIDRFDVASVSNLYAMVGVTGEFTDDQWGWNIESKPFFNFRKIPQGYLLELPAPIQL